MFKLTGSAYKMLLDIIQKEKVSEDEELYLRVSMGIG